MRVAGGLLLGVLAAGCEVGALNELSEPVGITCPETVAGEIDSAFLCPTDSRRAEFEFRRESPADLHLVLCNPTPSPSDGVLTGSFHVDVRRAVLGRFELPNARSIYYQPGEEESVPFRGRTGSVTLQGYDPARGVLCGELDIVLASEDSTEIVQRGTFVARLFQNQAPPDAGVDGAARDAADVCNCDDGVACTTDSCAEGACSHVPRHSACAAGELCSMEGCVAGAVCASDAACTSPDPCLSVRCDPVTRRCFYSPLDGDGDGAPPEVCGGDDCDDSNPAVHPGAVEACDGVDADCSGGPEPSAAAGCRPDEICLGDACGCAPGETLCDLRIEFGSLDCRDLQTDAFTCGSCTNHCAFGQECVDGACRCAPGLRDCIASHGVCADVSADPGHCGGCGISCPLRCVAGECSCPAPLTTCADGSGERCADLGSDVRDCGECGNRCLSSTCSAGRCPVDVGRFFDAYGRLSTPIAAGPRMARDAGSGNLIVRFRTGAGATGSRGPVPGGSEVMWNGDQFLGQFDGDGRWLRTIGSTGTEIRVFGGGGVHLALVESRAASERLGTVTVARTGASGAWTAVFALSAVDGTVLHASSLPMAFEHAGVLNDGRVVLLPYFSSAHDFGGGVALAADAARPWAIVWLAADGSVARANRIPGTTASLHVDTEGNVWTSSYVMESGAFTFGGDDFDTSGHYVAVYDSTGAHVRSFRLLNPTPLSHIVASADAVFAIETLTGTPQLRRYDVMGATATSTTAARVIDLGTFEWGGQVLRLRGSMRAAVVSRRQVALLDVEGARLVGEHGRFDLPSDVSEPVAAAHADGVYLAGALGAGPTRFGEDGIGEGYEGFFLTEIVFAP